MILDPRPALTMNNSLQKHGGRPRRYGRIALDLALVVTLLAALLAWFFDPFLLRLGAAKLTVSWGFKPLLIPLALALLRRWVARGMTPPPPALFPRIALALAAVLLPLAAMESLLTWAGVQPGEGVFVVRGEEGGALRADGSMVKDATLLWRFQPGTVFNGRRINSLGFLGRDVEERKPPDTQRVISLGDSCTAQGEPPYSDRLHDLLQQQAPTEERWEAFNMGVFGYSIEQGYRQFINQGRNLQPDVVTIYFGWNDHWLHDKPDRLRLATRMSPGQARVARFIQNRRLFGMLARRIKAQAPSPEAKGRGFRVPPEHYTETLSNLVVSIRSVGAQPLIITAARRELTPALVKTGHAEDLDVAEQAHDRYVELTRQVAESLQVPVLDLARDFSGPESDTYFSKDGIHFEKQGLQTIAERIQARLSELAEKGQLSTVSF